MKFKIIRKELIKQLEISNAAGVDKANSVKSGMVIKTVDDNTLLLQTNGDGINIISKVNANVLEEGEVNINPSLIFEFIKELEDEEIEFQVYNNVLSITNEKNIQTAFPILENVNITIPEIQVENKYNFDKKEFLNKLEKVKFAASTLPEQEHINCVRIEILDGKLKFVATDSYRLIYIEEEYISNTKLGLIANIPLKTVDGLIKILRKESDDNLEIKSEGMRIEFKIGDLKIYSKLIETQFPAYEGLFSSLNGDKNILIDISTFKMLLKRLQVFERQEKGSNVIFKMKDNKMTASINTNISKFKEDINILYDDSDEIKVSISVKFITEYLDTLKNIDIIRLKMYNSDRKPVVMYTSEEEKSYYIVMPSKF